METVLACLAWMIGGLIGFALITAAWWGVETWVL
jgi:hypothetical protein